MDRILTITRRDGAVYKFVYDEIFELQISARKWSVKIDEWGTYARTTLGRKQLRLHRLIMEWSGIDPAGYLVDHIDGDTTNNRFSNLRLSDPTGNSRNSGPRNGKVFKNIRIVPDSGRYAAYIGVQSKQIHIGVFSTEREALIAYDLKAAELFGEFCRPNINNPQPEEIEKVRAAISEPKKRNGLSRYRGVSPTGGKWVAQIGHLGNVFYIGRFDTEEQAALAYNKRAAQLLGDRAKLNIVR